MGLKDELEDTLSDITWNFIGILDTEELLHPIPKNINFQAIFEYLANERIREIGKKLECEILEAKSTREYPDIALAGGKLGKIIAIDVKTTRRINKDRISGFTLGSYAGYFRHPDKKMPFCGLPYGKYDEHWIVGFIYTWNEKADTLHMISDIELIVQPKWRIAGKTTGTGTTTAIGSIKSIRKLRKGKGDFETKEEFEKYWRNR